MKTVQLQHKMISTRDMTQLTAAFPSLESVTIENCYFHTDRRIFHVFEGLENLSNLEFDAYSSSGIDITAPGPTEFFTMSALSKLETLLVGADLFVYYTQDEENPILRTATVLPDSLRCLTILLNNSCTNYLAYAAKMRRVASKYARLARAFLQEQVAPALLNEYPHLEKVNLCDDMEDYRQHKVQILAARSTAGGGAAY